MIRCHPFWTRSVRFLFLFDLTMAHVLSSLAGCLLVPPSPREQISSRGNIAYLQNPTRDDGSCRRCVCHGRGGRKQGASS